MSAYLITQRGPEIGRRYGLSSAQFTIGRGQDNDLVLGDGLVSRYHAVIRQENEGIVIIDLGSTNPVLVNDVPLEAGVAHRLLHRDVLVVGSAVLSFQHQAGVNQPPAPAAPGGEPRTVVGGGLGGAARRTGAGDSPVGAPPLPHEAPVQPPSPPPVYEPAVPRPPAPYEPAIPPRAGYEPPIPPPPAYEPLIPHPPAASEPMTPGSWTPGSPLPPPPPPLTPPDLPPLPMTPEEARTVISRRPDAGPASPLQTPGRPPEPDDETPTVIRHRSPDA